MASSYKLFMNGTAGDDALYTDIQSFEVEENVDLPGAIQIKLPVTTNANGDLTYLTDSRFAPYANLAVVATPDGQADHCIFDGYVLSHKTHLETGTANSTVTVWGQDASWLMNLQEQVHEWVDVTDGDVANTIFGNYGITPAADNLNDDSPSHTEDGHSLMQRATDIQFLRDLARRNGKLCRVFCQDQPGQRTGYFAKPSLDGDPVVTLSLNDPAFNWTVHTLDLEWDVTRPTKVTAYQAVFNSTDPVGGDTTDSGLTALDQQSLSAFAGKDMGVLLTTPVDDGGELTMRAQALLREAGWFVRCEGEAEVTRINAVLRAGTVVQINGAGSLNSGKYYVWSVRHTIERNKHTMKFTLYRNALGPAPAGAAGGLLSGLTGGAL
jgi:phage protein D